MALIATSCQVKEGASDSGLISGHLPATNSFVLATPAAKTYVSGETLTLDVSFPFDLIKDNTGGEPRLRLTVGATTRYATFSNQPDAKTMQFTYSFVAGENDTDGVTVNALELNGSTLQFDNNGTITNCSVASLAAKTLSGIKVDTLSPTVSGLTLTNVPGMYNAGETLNFAMTFSEKVNVTGTPKFTITLSGSVVDVNYVSGSGSTVLLFSRTVAATDSDGNGFDAISSPIQLNGGTIKDLVGNDSSLVFSAYTAAAVTYSSTVHVSGSYPYIEDSIMPVNKTYLAAEDLDFTLIFDRAVNVTGLPYINVTIGSNVRQAQYVSGSGTEQLTFRYTTVPGDVDADGISITSSIIQNSGNINGAVAPTVSYFADALNNTFAHTATTGIIINAIQPQAIAVARNTDVSPAVWGTSLDNVWIPNQDLNITVNFNTNMYVTQTGGTPYIQLTVGGSTKQAMYLSGGNGQNSLVFRYTVQDGDLDTDGTIALGNIVLNGGVITDAQNTNTLLTLPVAGLTTTRIDGVKPTISSVSAPANATYSQVAPSDESALNFTVNWSEAVNLSNTSSYIQMDVGGTNVNLNYQSGSNSAAIVHRSASLASRNDNNGVTLSSPLMGTAVIKDQAGNTATVLTFTPPTTSSILVDTTAPTISSVTQVTANGTYKLNDTLDFSVTFSESVTTNKNGGYPRIPITIGGNIRYLEPVSSATALTHTFRYTIVANEVDTDGVEVGTALSNNGTGYARDAGRNNVGGSFTAPSTPALRVDSQIPTLNSSVVKVNGTTVSSPYGTWEVGDVLTVTATYSEIMNVTGTPRLALTIAGNTRYLNYSTGTGTTDIVFSYTFANDFDVDGFSTISAIALNGGTILDAGGNATTTQNLPSSIDFSSMKVLVAGVRLWVQKELVSLARAGSPTLSSTGAVTTVTCGSNQCRDFNGDDSLTSGGALSNVNTVFIVLRTPTAYGSDHNMFGNAIVMNASGSLYDITTSTSAQVYKENVLVNDYGGGTNHQTDINNGDANPYVFEVRFDSNQTISAGTLIPMAFDGRIGEIIAITGTPSSADLTTIRTYLMNKY